MSTMQDEYDVFISYRRDGGGERAILIEQELERRGYRVFLDVNDLYSGAFNEALYQTIENTPNFIVILTPQSLDRCLDPEDWVRKEIAHALKSKKNIIPIMSTSFVWPKDDLPAELEPLRKCNAIRELTQIEYYPAVFERLVTFMPPPAKTSRRRRNLNVACIAFILFSIPVGLFVYKMIPQQATSEVALLQNPASLTVNPVTPNPVDILKRAETVVEATRKASDSHRQSEAPLANELESEQVPQRASTNEPSSETALPSKDESVLASQQTVQKTSEFPLSTTPSREVDNSNAQKAVKPETNTPQSLPPSPPAPNGKESLSEENPPKKEATKKMPLTTKEGLYQALEIAGMTFRHIPQGSFTMAFVHNGRQVDAHRVTLTHDYWISTTEVTQKVYEHIMKQRPSMNGSEPEWPVDSVTWANAMDFCNRLSVESGKRMRLPTQAEWEYACRAGADLSENYGRQDATLPGDIKKMGLFRQKGVLNIKQKPIPVASKTPNRYGLYDMHGNVSELCLDGLRKYESGADVSDPKGREVVPGRSQCVVRGGDFLETPEHCSNFSIAVRSANTTSRTVGFRVLMEE